MKVTLRQAVDRFLRDREVDGYKFNTIDCNKTDLNKSLKAVDPGMDIRKLARAHVTAMLEYSVRLGNSDGTINSQIASLSAFCRWARNEGLMPPDQNPMAGRRYRTVVPRHHDLIPLSQFHQVLDLAGERHPRDRAFVALGLFTMLRVSEIRSLRVRDLDLELNTLNAVVHKTNDRDQMRVAPELRSEMRAWLTYYTEECGPLNGDWFLLPSRRSMGYGMGPSGKKERKPDSLWPTRPANHLNRIIHPVLTEMGWQVHGKHLGAHTLRRSAARALYEELAAEGVDDALRQTSAWLHHKSVTMTERYLGLTGDRERRNRRYVDAPMYPSLQGSNVTPLRGTNGKAHAAGM